MAKMHKGYSEVASSGLARNHPYLNYLSPFLPNLLTALLAYWLRGVPGEPQTWGLNPTCAMGTFPGCHTSDKIGAPAATLPGAWRYRVSARTGLPGVSIL